jgi:hypothetical protein
MDLTNIVILSLSLLTNSVSTNKTDVEVRLHDGSVGKLHQVISVEYGNGRMEFSFEGARVGGPFQFVRRWVTNNYLADLKQPAVPMNQITFPAITNK